MIFAVLFLASAAVAERHPALSLLRSSLRSGDMPYQAYTNHAGIVVAATPVRMEAKFVTLSNECEVVRYPLSIFPELERRRLAADYAARTGEVAALRLPADIRRAIDGNAAAIRRSEQRAAKGLCSREESEAFCAKSRAALRDYLDRQRDDGRLTPAERSVLTL